MFKYKKSLGQNFLIDKNIANKIVNITSINNQSIIEIGPGTGFLTDEIIKKKPKRASRGVKCIGGSCAAPWG